MAFRVEFATEAERDFELIFDHLVESYLGLGDGLTAAMDQARGRVQTIRAAADRIGAAPYRGTLHDDILPGLRHTSMDRAIYWFSIDSERETVRILAVFFGGQDHIRHMLRRLLG